ncbi:50S ribosomal protein L3 [Candidatus Bathyarchaeota archaeon]|nr:50S ribosomal protein L3 [Candidatus Bathyarchaeota archaeon]
MGHRKKSAPRRGSLAYLPRGRARRQVGRIRFWPEVETGPILLGFAGYKAGMTYVYLTDDRPNSRNYGKEVFSPVTIVEIPQMMVCAVRAYVETSNGLCTLTEAWMRDPPKNLRRVFPLPEKFEPEKAFAKIAESLDRVKEFRVIMCTQPWSIGLKKQPDLIEVKIGGGDIKQQFEYAKGLLGKTVRVSDVFKEGQFIDVIAVTKGKGFQGPVKRWGVHLLPHKSRKTRRGIGCLGPWHPAHLMYTVPRAGQMGYAQRTEYNKRIIKIGSNGMEVTPKGGFLSYGVVRGDYLMLEGSVPGPAKRLIRLRYPVRAQMLPVGAPKITYVSIESPQGK